MILAAEQSECGGAAGVATKASACRGAHVIGLVCRSGLTVCYIRVAPCVAYKSAIRLAETGKERLGLSERHPAHTRTYAILAFWAAWRFLSESATRSSWSAALRMSPGIHAGT